MPANKETSVGIKLVADLRNYQKNLTTAQKKTKTFGKNVKTNVGAVKTSFTGLAQGDIRQLPMLFVNLTKSILGFGKGMRAVDAILISSGVGALIVTLGLAVAGLTQYFKGTEEGQIAFKKVMNNISAYIEPVLQMLGKFGKAIVLFTKGKFGEAWETAKGAVKGTGEQIEKNKDNLEELNKAEEDYIKTKRSNLLANKKLEAEIASARLKANNEDDFSATQRQKAINEAISKQKELAANKNKELALETKIAETKASFGDNDIETNDKLAQLKAQQFEITREQDKKLAMISETQQRINRELVADVSLRQKQLDLQNELAQIAPSDAGFFEDIEKMMDADLASFGQPVLDMIGPIEILEEKLKKLQELQRLAFSPEAFQEYQTEIDGVTTQIDAFSGKLGELNETQRAVVGSVSSGFETLASSVVGSLGLASKGFAGFVSGLSKTVIQLIAQMLAASLSQSIAGATSSGVATGPAAVFATPAFIATAIGGVFSAFAAIPKFATGGIVPGGNFSGDRVLARVNSGEEILTRNDPRHRKNKSNFSGGQMTVNLAPDVKIDLRELSIGLKEVGYEDTRRR